MVLFDDLHFFMIKYNIFTWFRCIFYFILYILPLILPSSVLIHYCQIIQIMLWWGLFLYKRIMILNRKQQSSGAVHLVYCSVYVQFALTTSPGLKWMMRQNHRSATASVVGLQKKLMYKSGNHHDDNPSPFLEEEPDQPCWVPSSPSSYSPSSRLSPMHIPVMTSLGQLWIFSTSRAPTPTVTTPEDQQPHSELPGVSTQ